jgi:hypothetical protein
VVTLNIDATITSSSGVSTIVTVITLTEQ